jgi:hypothetical protein
MRIHAAIEASLRGFRDKMVNTLACTKKSVALLIEIDVIVERLTPLDARTVPLRRSICPEDLPAAIAD